MPPPSEAGGPADQRRQGREREPMHDQSHPGESAGRAAGQHALLVTGPSGAGLSTAIAALEDAGYEVVDNIPISLVCQLAGADGASDRLAVGLDGRNREFGAEAVEALLAALRARPGTRAELLFLDCAPTVLARRFAETRRPHPQGDGAGPDAGIERDAALMEPLREVAETLIDTSEMTVHDLRAQVARLYGPQEGRLSITVTSFSYRRGLPPGLDLVFDCRLLPNPHWVEGLRARDGRDPDVAAHALAGEAAAPFMGHVDGLVRLMLPAGRTGGRAHLGIGFGCTGGQHRSVAMAERVAGALAEEGWQVSKRHRELERHARRGTMPAAAGQGA